MPGLCGVVSRQMRLDAAMRSLELMQDYLRHREDQIAEEPMAFVPGNGLPSASAGAGALALGGVWRKPDFGFRAELQPGIELFFHGEAYGENAPLGESALVARFSALPFARGEFRDLAQMDGIYNAAIADQGRGLLHLITDPFGLRPLYVRETAGALWFAGELKALLAIGALQIDRVAASDFLRLGHFLGDATWFQGVRLLPPAAHLRYDLATGRLVLSQYRSWPPDGRKDIDGAAAALLAGGRAGEIQRATEVMGELFQQAVNRRATSGGRVGLLLSGGLDSRALFAAMPPGDKSKPLPLLTFGRPGCRDIDLALRVSALRPSQHQVVEITKDNWLEGREDGVWRTDGQLALHHMHGFESLPRLEAAMDTCLNGFLGDALLGGSYLGDPRWTLWEKYLHRGRRFVLPALHHGASGLRFRLPFLDLRLIEALSVLPESLLRDSLLYRHLLLQRWPEYFQRIPWQKTNMPLSLHPGRERFRVRSGRVGNRLLRLIGGKPKANTGEYYDYAHWLREEPAKAFVAATLFPEGGSALDTLVDPAVLKRVWESHVSGHDQTESLGRHLTAAIWLREAGKRTH